MNAPTSEDVRAALADFDSHRQKIVAGLLTVLMKNPARVREREWVAEQLTHLALMAGEFEADTPNEGVEAVQAFLHAHSEELVRATFLLFQRVGLDMSARADEEPGLEDALKCALEYFPASD